MKTAALLLLVTASLPALEVAGVDFKQEDKAAHAVLGAAVAATSMLALDRMAPDASWYIRTAVGVGAAALVGALKEASDSRDPKNHTTDVDDFTATTLGGTAVTLSLCWEF